MTAVTAVTARFDIVEYAEWHIGKYRHSRFWAVREGGPNGKLVCLCVYKKGAREVVRRLARLGGEEKATKSAAAQSSDTQGRRKGAVQ